MKKLSVSELAKLYGYSRQAIYAHINKGNLSKGSDGLIDFAEAIRVFGEPQKKDTNVNQSQSINSQNLTRRRNTNDEGDVRSARAQPHLAVDADNS